MNVKLGLAIMIFSLFSGCKKIIQREKIIQNIDETGPFINIKNYEYKTTLGNAIDFSNITGYDDVDGVVKVVVTGYIDYNTIGDYFPVLVSRDTSGNESRVAVTIHVLEAFQTDQPKTESTIATIENHCEQAEAKSSTYACNMVLPEELLNIKTLYIGENGDKRCIEASMDESQSCKAIYRNNGELWGYGQLK